MIHSLAKDLTGITAHAGHDFHERGHIQIIDFLQLLKSTISKTKNLVSMLRSGKKT